MRRIKSVALSCLLLALAALPTAALAADATLSIASGNIVITAGVTGGWQATQGANTVSGTMADTLTILGTGTTAANPTANAITLQNVGRAGEPVPIVLNNVHIQTFYDAMVVNTLNAFSLDGAHATLTLVGNSSLTTKHDTKAAVRVTASASLTLKGDGSLTAKCIPLDGGDYDCRGAAIGGNGNLAGSGEACGKVKIMGSVHVTAICGIQGGDSGVGAGIGGGGGYAASGSSGVTGGDGGEVEISGQATVTAGSYNGAGIGGGGCIGTASDSRSGNGGTVTILGGTVTASSVNGAGIGGGYGSYACGNGGKVEVSSGMVIASSNKGAGIGGGASQYGTGGDGAAVVMTGGELKAKTPRDAASGAAIGGGACVSASQQGNMGTVNLNGFSSYEWGTTENEAYIVHTNDLTAYPHNNNAGFKGIRSVGVFVTPTSLIFERAAVGYTVSPDAQHITIINNGSGTVTPQALSSNRAFQIVTPQDWTTPLSQHQSRSFTVQPKVNLPPGTYDETLTVTDSTTTNIIRNVYLFFQVGIAPTISGDQSMTLPEGYATPQFTNEYNITGDFSPRVDKEPDADVRIAWDDTSKRLKINVVLPAGTYPVQLIASNGIRPNATLPFTLTVTSATPPTIGIAPANSFPEGQCGGNYDVTIGAGTPQTDLNITHLRADGLTWTNPDGTTRTLTEHVEYTKRNGSIIITLNQRFLNALPIGRYTLTARLTGGVYDEQTVSLPITVTAPVSEAPQTGDSAAPGLWLLLCGLAGLGALALFSSRRRA